MLSIILCCSFRNFVTETLYFHHILAGTYLKLEFVFFFSEETMYQCFPPPRRVKACDTKTAALQSLEPHGNAVAMPSIRVFPIKGKNALWAAPQHEENMVTMQDGAVILE